MNGFPVEPAVFASFAVMMAAFAVTPGPANVFMMATGLNHGRSAVPWAVLGLCLATTVWYVAAALGLIALSKAFPLAFKAMAVLGGLYILWLAYRTLRPASAKAAPPAPPQAAPDDTSASSSGAGQTRLSSLAAGFVVQIANPKAIVFFSGALPPFLNPEAQVLQQFAVFAATTLVLDALAMGGYGLLAAAAAQAMQAPRVRARLNLTVGALLLLSAVLVLWRAFS